MIALAAEQARAAGCEWLHVDSDASQPLVDDGSGLGGIVTSTGRTCPARAR